ncbi:MAG: O-antigen ligase family protein [Myxococcales bacterium]|nr:O-antigen ligase family protein [Myxococcales bacterium]
MLPRRLILAALLTAFTVFGWVVIEETVPVYAFPLVFGYLTLLFGYDLLQVDRSAMLFAGVFLLFVAWASIGLTFVPEPGRCAAAIRNWVGSLAIALLVYRLVHDERDALFVIRLFAALHVAGLVLAAVQVFTGSGVWSPAAKEWEPTGFEGMSYLFGKNYLPIAAFGLAGLLVRQEQHGGLGRKEAVALLILGIAGVALSDGRSTQIGLAAGLLVTAFRRSGRARAWAIAATTATAIASLSLSASWEAMLGKYDEVGDSRPLLWTTSLQIFREHPLTGIGSDQFRFVALDYAPPDWDGTELPEHVAPHPHNVFLGILAENGLPGLVLFLGALTVLLGAASRISKSAGTTGIIGQGIILFLIMFAIDMNFHNYFNDNNLWVFAGLTLALNRVALNARPPVPLQVPLGVGVLRKS